MAMVTVSIPDDLKRRLDTLALETERTLEESILVALSEFVETWERHLDDVHQIEEGEMRAVLRGGDSDSDNDADGF